MMTEEQRTSAVSMAKTVIERRRIFEPIAVSLAESVLLYETAIAEEAKQVVSLVRIRK